MRSCYETDVRFYRDDQRTCRVRYFFVDADVPCLPGRNAFRPISWLPEWRDGGVVYPIGEVYDAERPWVDGEPVNNADGRSGHFCGTEEQFRSGESVPPVPHVPLDILGTPTCCPGAGEAVETLPITTAGFAFQGGANTLDATGLNSSPGAFLLLRQTPPSLWHTHAGAVVVILGNPPQFVTVPAQWFANVLEGGIEVKCVLPAPVGGTGIVLTFVGFPNPTTAPMPVVDSLSWPAAFGNATVTVPGYSFTAEEDTDVIPIGTVFDYAGSGALPAKWLECDGSRVSAAVYPELFGVCGFSFGLDLSDGTFPLPDLRDRTVVGAGTAFVVGDSFGANSHALSLSDLPRHTPTGTVDSHSHDTVDAGKGFFITTGYSAVQVASGTDYTILAPAAGSDIPAVRPATASTQPGITMDPIGSNGSFELYQPSACLRKMIYAGR